IIAGFDGVLAWGDLATTNILVDETGRLTGLVDFESSFVLDSTLSVGYLYGMNPEHPLIHALLDVGRASGSVFVDEKLKLCAALRAVRMAKFAHRDLPSGELQHPIQDVLPGAIRAVEQLVETL